MAQSKIEAEIVKVLDVKDQGRDEDRQEFLARLVRDKEVDKRWAKFSGDAQAWLNASTELDNDDKDIEDFPDFKAEADDDAGRGGRGRGDDDRGGERGGREERGGRGDDRGGDRDRERGRDDDRGRGGDRDDRGRGGREDARGGRDDDRGGDRDRDRGRDERGGERDRGGDRGRDDRGGDRDRGREEPRGREERGSGDRDRGGRDEGGATSGRVSSSRGNTTEEDRGGGDGEAGDLKPATVKEIKQAVIATPGATADAILKKLKAEGVTKEQVAAIRKETRDTIALLQDGGHLKKKMLS